MTTVASRTIRCSPHRSAAETWCLIVELLTKDADQSTRDELLAAAGVASCILAEKTPESAAITVTCDGPRTRIYCLYDEDAIDGSDAREEPLGYNPLRGKWSVSLPCPKDDLPWVAKALRAQGNRVTARDASETLGEAADSARTTQAITVNLEEFLKP